MVLVSVLPIRLLHWWATRSDRLHSFRRLKALLSHFTFTIFFFLDLWMGHIMVCAANFLLRLTRHSPFSHLVVRGLTMAQQSSGLAHHNLATI